MKLPLNLMLFQLGEGLDIFKVYVLRYGEGSTPELAFDLLPGMEFIFASIAAQIETINGQIVDIHARLDALEVIPAQIIDLDARLNATDAVANQAVVDAQTAWDYADGAHNYNLTNQDIRMNAIEARLDALENP